MYVANVCSKCFKHMSHVFRLDVVMIIQVCFNSTLHMLQWSDGCCKGDDTIGLGKGNGRDRAWWRTGARLRWRHIVGRSAVWRGKERGRLDAGGATGWGLCYGRRGCNRDRDQVTDGRLRSLAWDRSWVAGCDFVAGRGSDASAGVRSMRGGCRRPNASLGRTSGR